jgi:glycosyltransferase involved in cell wall biosynthesis
MLSAVIITKNEERMIGECLKSLTFADEILVVDTGNTDNTNFIAKKHHARIVKFPGQGYDQYRNAGLKSVRGDWILYIDADERVSPELAREITGIISAPDPRYGAYELPRKNIYLGKAMKYGGWGNDSVIRLFPKNKLVAWHQPLHEQPEFTGLLKKLDNFIIHYSHRDLSSMLAKTISFTDYEARLRLAANHPPVTWWRFFRVMFTEFWYRFVKLQAWRDGTAGVIDGIFQVYNSFIIYARLWELQHEKKSSDL